MATAWNVKKLHNCLDKKIKPDIDKIYSDLTKLNSAILNLMAQDQKASNKNDGERISNFSGSSAYRYFNVLTKDKGFFSNEEKFYKKIYSIGKALADKGLERGIIDKIANYKSAGTWTKLYPRYGSIKLCHQIDSGVKSDIVNVSSNIMTLKNNVKSCYNDVINDSNALITDLKIAKKYTPNSVDEKITKVIKNIEKRIEAKKLRRDQLDDFVNEAVLQFLLSDKNAASEYESQDTNDESDSTLGKF